MTELRAFTSPEHDPFLWPGGDGAALLIHGFPGTPAEMRPAGEVLRDAGWTVQGLLLPGFGSDFATLPDRHHGDWVATIESALTALRAQHRTVILVGNSMGAALALRVAAHQPVDGLILFAPFWRVDHWLERAYPLAELLLREIKPFQRANFADPAFRANLAEFMPDADLDDPAVQAAIRELSLPVRVLGQVRRSGQLGYRFAAQVQAPVLIVQGRDDPLVKPAVTRRLAARLPRPPQIVEVAGGHDLVRGKTPDWAIVAGAMAEFAGRIDRGFGG
jgi:carboxylesterase